MRDLVRLDPSQAALHVTLERRLLHPRHWGHWITVGLLYVGGLLPWPLMTVLANLIGQMLYVFATFRRRVATVNIQLCFPHLTPAQQRKLVRDIFASHVMGLFETTIAWWGEDDMLRPRMRANGFDKLRAHQQTGQGAIVIGCHFTTLDLAGRLFLFNADTDVVYRRQKYPVYDFFMRRNRERLFKHAIERSDTRQLIRNIKQGRTVWYAPDQDYGKKNAVFAPFFGIPAATLTATSRLARITDAPVFLCTHYRQPGGYYDIAIEGPLKGFPTGDDVNDATFINAIIESAIRRHPEQYMWLHKRFKSRPDGEAGFYPKRTRKRKRSRDLR
jgi:Kdo2-lipid IVA lauroyltransferase/acyltransferase